MLEHQTISTKQPQSAANVRVTPEELAKALAALEARSVGYSATADNEVVIGEAIHQLGLDMTPEAIWAEIQSNQARTEADELSETRRKRIRLVRWGIGTAIVAAVIGGIVCSQTFCNPIWQVKHQRQVFLEDLRQTLGPHPRYHIVVAPEEALWHNPFWGGFELYPITEVPDGYTIHSGTEAPILGPARYVAFVDARTYMNDDWAFTQYGGVCYCRGWVPRWQLPSLLGHHRFLFVHDSRITPGVVQESEIEQKGWVISGRQPIAPPQQFIPLTLSLQSISQQNAQVGFLADATTIYTFPEGQTLRLDKHAWEMD